MSTAMDIARELDALGITAINFMDPEDKSPVPGIRLADAAILLGVHRSRSATGTVTHGCSACGDVHLPPTRAGEDSRVGDAG